MDSNHDIVPTLRMFDGLMMNKAADEIERLRSLLAEKVAGQEPVKDAAPAQSGEPFQARAASTQSTATQPVQTERALTDTELEKLYWTAMNNAADILGYMEEARALLIAAQPASSLSEGGE